MSSELNHSICIIVPAYNEAATLKGVLQAIRWYCPTADVVVVNDASTDATQLVAEAAGVFVLSLPINLGIGGAMQTGFKYATREGYDIAMQVDGDGQHDPRFIPDLLAPLLANTADMVIGSRFLRPVGYTSSLLRLFGIRLFAYLIGLVTNKRVFDSTSGYRAYNRPALVFAAQYYPSDFPEPESIVTFLRNDFRLQEVPVVMQARAGGVSSVRVGRGMYFVLSNAIAILVSGLKRRLR